MTNLTYMKNTFIHGSILIFFRYSKGFQKIQSLLDECTLDDTILARNVAEVMLWGPNQAHLMILRAPGDLELSCSVWLESKRCEMVNRFAMQEADHNIEEANYIKFLCASTGKMLKDTITSMEDV